MTDIETKYTLKIGGFIRSSASLKKCFALTKNGNRLETSVVADIVVVDELKKQAFLQNIAVSPDSPVTQCISQSLSRLSLPPPPKSPLPFSIVLLLINDY